MIKSLFAAAILGLTACFSIAQTKAEELPWLAPRA